MSGCNSLLEAVDNTTRKEKLIAANIIVICYVCVLFLSQSFLFSIKKKKCVCNYVRFWTVMHTQNWQNHFPVFPFVAPFPGWYQQRGAGDALPGPGACPDLRTKFQTHKGNFGTIGFAFFKAPIGGLSAVCWWLLRCLSHCLQMWTDNWYLGRFFFFRIRRFWKPFLSILGRFGLITFEVGLLVKQFWSPASPFSTSFSLSIAFPKVAENP